MYRLSVCAGTVFSRAPRPAAENGGLYAGPPTPQVTAAARRSGRRLEDQSDECLLRLWWWWCFLSSRFLLCFLSSFSRSRSRSRRELPLSFLW